MTDDVRVGVDDEFERAAFVSESPLPARFHEEGMVWLANRVLHPFGWAIGVVWDDEREQVTGLVLMRTRDPEGIVTREDEEVNARRRFFGALRRRPETAPAETIEESLAKVCRSCGFRMWESGERTGCPNPRCREYEPIPRTP